MAAFATELPAFKAVKIVAPDVKAFSEPSELWEPSDLFGASSSDSNKLKVLETIEEDPLTE